MRSIHQFGKTMKAKTNNEKHEFECEYEEITNGVE